MFSSQVYLSGCSATVCCATACGGAAAKDARAARSGKPPFLKIQGMVKGSDSFFGGRCVRLWNTAVISRSTDLWPEDGAGVCPHSSMFRRCQTAIGHNYSV